MVDLDRQSIRARVRDGFHRETEAAPEIKREFVERHGSGETDSEWSVRCFDGEPDGVAGESRRAFSGEIVLLNTSRLDQMSTPELDATIAHERGHQENEHRLVRGLWICVILVVFVFVASGLFADFLLVRVVGGIGIAVVAMLLGAWWSRRAEYRADRFAVERLGSPEPVITMLKGMQNGDEDGDDESDGDESDTGRANELRCTISQLFNTHPLPSERIKRIKRDERAGSSWNSGCIEDPR